MTPSGRSFVTQARRLLEAERGFDNRAQGIGQQLIGELHVGCYFIAAPFLLGQVVQRLASKHPGLKLTLHEGDLIRVVRDLKAGHTEVAATYDIYLDGAVECESLFETSPHVIVSERDPLAATVLCGGVRTRSTGAGAIEMAEHVLELASQLPVVALVER